jgi:3-deoxy-D-manno-octulosonic-acid transferase
MRADGNRSLAKPDCNLSAEKVPVALVNARLSERSLRKAQRLSSLITPAAKAISVIAAQTSEDASRLQSLSGNAPAITGNIKFDVSVPQQQLNAGAAMRAQCGTRLSCCAPVHGMVKKLILEAFLKKWPRGNTTQNAPLLLLVPRHPQRFDAVAEMLAQAGLPVRRSALTTTEHSSALASADVLLGDSMGEMFMYYAMADLAFIGGSLLPFGGHNLIEPCAIGKPVLIGLHTFNFSDVTGQAIAARCSFTLCRCRVYAGIRIRIVI